MLEPLLGSVSKERVLVFLYAREEGYPREISAYFDVDIRPIQNQLTRLEKGGVLSSRLVGRSRVYVFNPRYPFLKELQALLQKALDYYPGEERERLLMARRRPRRSGKPL